MSHKSVDAYSESPIFVTSLGIECVGIFKIFVIEEGGCVSPMRTSVIRLIVLLLQYDIIAIHLDNHHISGFRIAVGE